MMKRIENINNYQIRNPRHQICNKDSYINCKRKSDEAMIYSHQISDSTKRKTVTHSFNYPFTCDREKPVLRKICKLLS